MTELVIGLGVLGVCGVLWLIVSIDQFGPLSRAMLEIERWEREEQERQNKGAK